MMLTIVVPVYNERTVVRTLLDRVLALPIEKQVVVVDDGSTDGTSEVLREVPRRADLEIVHSPVNLGKGASVRIGVSRARGDIVAIQDADLELDPSELVRLVEPIREGRADVVFGVRHTAPGYRQPLPSRAANRALSLMTSVLFLARVSDMETCFKVLRTDAFRGLGLRANRFEIEPEIVARVLKSRLRWMELPVPYFPRSVAAGKKITWHDGVLAVLTLLHERVRR
jgi:dolichol-phosphate mannosyltransferase